MSETEFVPTGGGIVNGETQAPTMIVPKAVTPETHGECCGSCSAFSPLKSLTPKRGEARQGYCRSKPPIIVQTMVEAPPMSVVHANQQGPRVVPAYQGLWPPTAEDGWCREWEPRKTREG